MPGAAALFQTKNDEKNNEKFSLILWPYYIYKYMITYTGTHTSQDSDVQTFSTDRSGPEHLILFKETCDDGPVMIAGDSGDVSDHCDIESVVRGRDLGGASRGSRRQYDWISMDHR